MRRIIFSALLVLTACGATTDQAIDVESVDDAASASSAPGVTVASVADDSAPVVLNEPDRFGSGILECPRNEMESGILDYGSDVAPLSDDNTAAGVAEWFMSSRNPDWQLRRDWQRLTLDPGRSSGNTFVFVDEDGFAYLRLTATQVSGSWVVGNMSSCAPLPEDLVMLDDDFVPIPDSSGSLPFHQRLECAGNLVSMEFLWWLPEAKGRDFGQMRSAMDPFLESPEGAEWPADLDWYVAHADEDNRVAPHATLVAQHDEGFAWMNLEMEDGLWTWAGASLGRDCELHVLLDARSTVEWVVVGSSPESDVVRVRATERACAGGEEMGDRLREPVVRLTPDVAYVLVTAEPPDPTRQRCPGNPSVEFDVDLGEPLGTREIQNTQTSMGWFSSHWPHGEQAR